jgi:hypothetical protein
MGFDPKKILDDTLNQVGQSSSRRYDDRHRDHGREGDVDDLIYSISRDVEEIRIKNRELNDRISDLERKFSRLKELMRNRRY